MTKLENVTIILYDGVGKPDTAKEVMTRILRVVSPTHAKIVSPNPPKGDWESCEVPEVSWNAGQRVQSFGLQDFSTSHMMMCELDGFPINPHHWNPDWLQYDYIGAPWGYAGCRTQAPREFRVGNGGCSLQSKKLRSKLWEFRYIYKDGTPSDLWICQDLRRCLALKKFSFAPVSEAIKFSFESEIPEFPDWTTDQSFAFHGRNFHPHLCP